jgi:trimeric autotransporter adhesin
LRSEPKRRKEKLTAAALACVLFAGLAFQVACGGSSNSGGGGGSKGTPAGTYTITVTGTYSTGSLAHSTPTTLMVQ